RLSQRDLTSVFIRARTNPRQLRTPVSFDHSLRRCKRVYVKPLIDQSATFLLKSAAQITWPVLGAHRNEIREHLNPAEPGVPMPDETHRKRALAPCAVASARCAEHWGRHRRP